MGQLSELLVNQRAKLGFTRGDAAKRAGVSEGFISKLEHGGVHFLFQRLHAVSIIYKICPTRLLEAAWFDATGLPLRDNYRYGQKGVGLPPTNSKN